MTVANDGKYDDTEQYAVPQKTMIHQKISLNGKMPQRTLKNSGDK